MVLLVCIIMHGQSDTTGERGQATLRTLTKYMSTPHDLDMALSSNIDPGEF